MPTYGYRCTKNGHEFEIVQSIVDPPVAKCIECNAPVKRVFYPVGIVFKGQGFYKTDSRGKESSSISGAPSASAASEKTKTDSAGSDSRSSDSSGGGTASDSAAKSESSSPPGGPSVKASSSSSSSPGKTASTKPAAEGKS